ncbi:gluconokinase [Deinococcus radiotolerans]|uniref:Gluconokinase n=1 Tax=Deinococcus radiotolerans TaxID=1309407 RepID=A0ABQ2FIQ3_9DEIO|nr:gluconokinase [Deinococcus radiotolerans]GGK92651.1 gluconokinase [Deinococcus radiotolerans]
MTLHPIPLRVVVMGVSGSGKSTLGRALGAALHAPFLDGDDYHTPAARARMHAGHGLTDEERAPWLRTLRAQLDEHSRVVLACSALKRTYRDTLRAPGTHFLYLNVPEPLLRERLVHRAGHYAGADLLPSQLATLEPPQADEHDLHILSVTPGDTPEQLLAHALTALKVT